MLKDVANLSVLSLGTGHLDPCVSGRIGLSTTLLGSFHVDLHGSVSRGAARSLVVDRQTSLDGLDFVARQQPMDAHSIGSVELVGRQFHFSSVLATGRDQNQSFRHHVQATNALDVRAFLALATNPTPHQTIHHRRSSLGIEIRHHFALELVDQPQGSTVVCTIFVLVIVWLYQLHALSLHLDDVGGRSQLVPIQQKMGRLDHLTRHRDIATLDQSLRFSATDRQALGVLSQESR